jgi:ABC-type antimicrobial peptide transport system permease subunit
MNFYLKVFYQGISRLFTLPRLSLPVVLTLSLTLAGVLAVIAMISNMVLKPLPDIKNEEALYSVKFDLKISDVMTIPFINEKRLAELTKAYHQHGDFASLETGRDSLNINESEVEVTKFAASTNFPTVVTHNRLMLGEAPNKENIDNGVWISESLWRNAYQANINVLNTTLEVNEKTRQIKGIYQNLISYNASAEKNEQQIWQFYSLDEALLDAETKPFGTRLGIFFRQNSKALTADDIIQFFNNYAESNSESVPISTWLKKFENDVQVTLFRDVLLDGQNSMLILLLVTVIVLLIMSSLNLLNLFIAYYQKRRQEFATQLFLGASVGKLKRMVFIENLPTFLLSSFLGLLGAAWVIRLLPIVSGGNIKHLELIQLDSFTIISSVCLVLLINFIFSTIAVKQFDHKQLLMELNSGNKGVNSVKVNFMSKFLFVAQVSSAVVILTGSAMLADSAYSKLNFDLGFEVGNTYLATVSLNSSQPPLPHDRAELMTELAKRQEYNQEQHQQLSGIVSAAFPYAKVLKGQGEPFGFALQGVSVTADTHDGSTLTYGLKHLAPDYISAFKLKLIAGRNVTEEEFNNNDKVVIINKTLAKSLSKDGVITSVLGTEFDEHQVIGVVTDHYSFQNQEGKGFAIAHYKKSLTPDSIQLVLQLPNNESIDHDLLESTIRSSDLSIKKVEVISLHKEWDHSNLGKRVQFYFVLMLTFLTLLLATLGSNGMALSFTELKRFELAVRMATGASRVSLLKKTLKDFSGLLLSSVIISVLLASTIYLILKEKVAEMPSFSWQSLLLFNVLLLAIVCSAITLVVWKTINKDPMKALREN